MNKLWQLVFEPQHQRWRWVFSISISLYYFLFFRLFAPFQSAIEFNNPDDGFKATLIYVLIIFVTLISSLILFPKYNPASFSSKNFTLNKFYLFVLVCFVIITTVNFPNFAHFSRLEWSFLGFFKYLFTAALPNIILVSLPLIVYALFMFSYIIEKENEKRSALSQSEINASEGTPQYKDAFEPQIFHFTDTTNKKNFYISKENLYYITSDHNYIEVHYQKKDGSNSRLVLRNSLKALEETLILDKDSALIRCHKGYIINREKVVELRRPAKAAHFILENIEEPIPVSRHKFADLEAQFRFSYH
jgi:hypothetical protein